MPPDDTGAVAADLAIAAAADGRMTPVVMTPVVLARMLGVSRRDSSITDEDDLLTVLQRVAGIADDAVNAADSTVVTIDLGADLHRGHTDDRTLRVDSEQYDAGDGPCLHASRTRSVVLVDASDAVDRWPRFAAAAREEGIHSFLAAPLFTPEQTLGSFNLYGRTRCAFDDVDAEVLDLLTTAVSRAIGDFARFRSARDVAESIQRALETRAPIEQAKGMLMAIHGIDADEAFDLLREQSQTTNVRLRTSRPTWSSNSAHRPNWQHPRTTSRIRALTAGYADQYAFGVGAPVRIELTTFRSPMPVGRRICVAHGASPAALAQLVERRSCKAGCREFVSLTRLQFCRRRGLASSLVSRQRSPLREGAAGMVRPRRAKEACRATTHHVCSAPGQSSWPSRPIAHCGRDRG